jgi:hypothetical protein
MGGAASVEEIASLQASLGEDFMDNLRTQCNENRDDQQHDLLSSCECIAARHLEKYLLLDSLERTSEADENFDPLLHPIHMATDDDSNYLLEGLSSESSLHIRNKWDPGISSVFLQFSHSNLSVHRDNLLGCYPSALLECGSCYAAVTMHMERAPRRDNYLSFGIAVYDRIPSAELGACLGKIPFTWGIVDRRNNLQPSEIWAEGHIVQKYRPLQEGDDIVMIYDGRISIGACKLFLNNSLVYTFGPLDAKMDYVFGCTVCPDHAVTILDRGIEALDDRAEADEDGMDRHNHTIVYGTNNSTSSSRNERTAESPQTRRPTDQPPVPELFPRDMRLLGQTEKKKGPRPENRCVDPPKAPPSITEEENAASKLCCICLENPKCVVLLPCKHLCVCETCGGEGVGVAKKVEPTLKNCPMCRESIKQRLKVFL